MSWEEMMRRNAIRMRALATIKDCTQLIIRVSPERGRQITRHLNDTIGILGYELVGWDPVGNGLFEVEAYVPGSDLALLLKLAHQGF